MSDLANLLREAADEIEMSRGYCDFADELRAAAESLGEPPIRANTKEGAVKKGGVGLPPIQQRPAPPIGQRPQPAVPEPHAVLGWTHAYFCCALDEGLDPRRIEVPKIIEAMEKQLLAATGDSHHE